MEKEICQSARLQDGRSQQCNFIVFLLCFCTSFLTGCLSVAVTAQLFFRSQVEP